MCRTRSRFPSQGFPEAVPQARRSAGGSLLLRAAETGAKQSCCGSVPGIPGCGADVGEARSPVSQPSWVSEGTGISMGCGGCEAGRSRVSEHDGMDGAKEEDGAVPALQHPGV